MDVDPDTRKAIEAALKAGTAVETGRVRLHPPETAGPGGLEPGVTEGAFQQKVIDLARANGWLCAHFAPARVRRRGKEVYETPVRADGRGFPDLILVHPGRGELIVAELKSTKGVTRPEQVRWLDAFRATGCAAGVWRPEDWKSICKTLTGGSHA